MLGIYVKACMISPASAVVALHPMKLLASNFFCTLQVLTQVSLILLLFGTIVGDFALISDVSARAFKGLAAPDTPPAWLVAYDGRGTMCLFAVVAVWPLCCLKGMRQVRFAHIHFLLACKHSHPAVSRLLLWLLEM